MERPSAPSSSSSSSSSNDLPVVVLTFCARAAPLSQPSLDLKGSAAILEPVKGKERAKSLAALRVLIGDISADVIPSPFMPLLTLMTNFADSQLSYEAHETEQQHHYSNNICDNAPQTMLHLQLAATVYLKTNGNRIVTGREGVAFYSLLEEHQLLQNKDISQGYNLLRLFYTLSSRQHKHGLLFPPQSPSPLSTRNKKEASHGKGVAAASPSFSSSSLSPGSCGLLCLGPNGELFNVLRFLTNRDAQNLAQASLELSQAIGCFLPGLNTKPYPHQIECLKWMMTREHHDRNIPHPAYSNGIRCEDGNVLHVNMMDGTVIMSERDVPRVKDIRGGMLCDEPGMGKTFTAIMLISTTLGRQVDGTVPFRNPYEDANLHRASARLSSYRTPPHSIPRCATTLIIVPGDLVRQWKQQFDLHLHPDSMPKIFMKHGREDLPSIHKLWKNDVVLLSREAIGREYRQHGMNSVLLQCQWFRIIIDEGHQLGTTAISNAGLMSALLQAERKWVLTGTPTKDMEADDLAGLRGLLKFLGHEPYGMRDSSAWDSLIARPFRLRKPIAFHRLITTLEGLISMRDKDYVKNIMGLELQNQLLTLTPYEQDNYNTVVAIAMNNLNLLGLKNKHGVLRDHPDCYLNPHNRVQAEQILSVLDLVNGGGGEVVTVAGGVEDVLRRSHLLGASEDQLARLQVYLEGVADRRLQPCDHCGLPLRILVISTCMCFLCCECIKGMEESCRVCGNTICVETLQALQPAISWQVQYDETDQLDLSRASKVKYLVRQFQAEAGRPPVEGEHRTPQKTIIYSRNTMTLDLLAWVFGKEQIKFVRSFEHTRDSLQRFREDPEIGVLLLNHKMARGHDLEFATKVILMETLWDASAEKQVIGRAHRLGSQSKTIVESLMAKESIDLVAHERVKAQREARAAGHLLDEEQEEEDEEESAMGSSSSSPSRWAKRPRAYKQARTEFLLTRLRLMRPSQFPSKMNLGPTSGSSETGHTKKRSRYEDTKAEPSEGRIHS